MSHLEEEHPEAFKYLTPGGFDFQSRWHSPWEKFLLTRHAKKLAVNKDTQTAEGTKGV